MHVNKVWSSEHVLYLSRLRTSVCSSLKLVVCTFWMWVNECWLKKTSVSLKKHSLITWFMSGWRRRAMVPHHLRGRQLWVCVLNPLSHLYSTTLKKHTTVVLYKRPDCSIRCHRQEQTGKLDGKPLCRDFREKTPALHLICSTGIIFLYLHI